MDLSDAWNSIDVIVHPSPPEWWQIAAAFGPLALVIAVVPFAFWYLCPRRKPEPWSRIQQALDMAVDDRPEKRRAGLALLEQLSSGGTLSKVDAEIVANARAILGKPHS